MISSFLISLWPSVSTLLFYVIKLLMEYATTLNTMWCPSLKEINVNKKFGNYKVSYTFGFVLRTFWWWCRQWFIVSLKYLSKVIQSSCDCIVSCLFLMLIRLCLLTYRVFFILRHYGKVSNQLRVHVYA